VAGQSSLPRLSPTSGRSGCGEGAGRPGYGEVGEASSDEEGQALRTLRPPVHTLWFRQGPLGQPFGNPIPPEGEHEALDLRVSLCPAGLGARVSPVRAATGKVVRVKLTSAWSTPSPDPMGITYDSRTHRLLVCDSEVDEMPSLWKGRNFFVVKRKGKPRLFPDVEEVHRRTR